MSNVGFATLSIIPSALGFQAKLGSQLSGPADAAGAAAGARASKSLTDSLTNGMARAGKTLTKAVTLPLVAFAAAGVKAAVDLDKGLREVNTLFGLTGAAGEKSFADLSAMVLNLSKDLGIAQSTLTGGLYQAISAGVPKENAFTFMQVASKAAIAGVTDVETAVDGLTTIINAFGLKATDAGRVADSMFTTVKGGKTTFAELSDALFNIAPAAAASKVSMEEVNAAIATLTASGTPTSVATTQLRAALVGLQRPSTEMNAIFGKLGFANAQAAIEAKGLTFALDAVKDAAGGDTGKLQTLLGSVEAVAAANVLAGTGAAKMATELENQGKKAGATETAFAEMEKSTARRFERLKVNFQNLAIFAGEKLIPALEKLAGGVQRLMDWFERLSPSAQKLVGIGSIVLAALGPVLIVSAKLIKAGKEVADALGKVGRGLGLLKKADGARGGLAKLPGLLRSVGSGVTDAVKGFASFTKESAKAVAAGARAAAAFVAQAARTIAAFVATQAAAIASAAAVAAAWLAAAAPFIALGVAIAAVVLVVVKNWDTIKAATLAVWNFILDFIRQWWPLLLGIVTGGIGLVIGLIIQHWDQVKAATAAVWNAILGAIQAVWAAITSVVSGAVNTVSSVISGVLGTIRAIWSTAWNALSGIVSTAFSAVGTAVRNGVTLAVTFVEELPSRARQALGNLLSVLVQAGKDLIQGFINGVKSLAGAVGGAVKDVVVDAPVNLVKKGLSIFSPSRVFFDLGRNTMEGFRLGLGDRSSAIHRTVSAMSDSLTGLFPGAPLAMGTNAALAPLASSGGGLAQAPIVVQVTPGQAVLTVDGKQFAVATVEYTADALHRRDDGLR